MMKNSCVLRAVLKASAELGRPLSPATVSRLVHITERHKGWPYGKLDELFDLLEDDLDAVGLVASEGTTTLAARVPVIMMYEGETDRHASFGYAPHIGGVKMEALIILQPKETKA